MRIHPRWVLSVGQQDGAMAVSRWLSGWFLELGAAKMLSRAVVVYRVGFAGLSRWFCVVGRQDGEMVRAR